MSTVLRLSFKLDGREAETWRKAREATQQHMSERRYSSYVATSADVLRYVLAVAGESDFGRKPAAGPTEQLVHQQNGLTASRPGHGRTRSSEVRPKPAGAGRTRRSRGQTKRARQLDQAIRRAKKKGGRS